jgi:hypothetical protein
LGILSFFLQKALLKEISSQVVLRAVHKISDANTGDGVCLGVKPGHKG